MPTQRTWNASGRAKFIARRTRNGMARFRMAVYRVRQGMARFRMVAYRKISSAGRFVLVAPVLPPLAAFVGEALVPVQQNALSYDRRIDDNASGSFTVADSGVGYDLSENRKVMIFDSQSSITLYRGFIDRVDESLVPGSSTNMRTVTLKDLRWLAEKRTWTGDEFPDWTAGDIAAELHRTVLVNEGISAAYALRHDMDTASLGAGTLAGTSASSGDLELAPAGTPVIKMETTTANWNAGTRTNTTGAANALTLTPISTIKFTSTCNGLPGSRIYQQIWGGSYTLVSGDALVYSMWIADSSPAQQAFVHLHCSNGNNSGGLQDSLSWNEENQDLSGYAKNQWYARTVDLTPIAGSALVSAFVCFDASAQGQYTAYFHTIKVMNGATTKATIFASTLNKNMRTQDFGYSKTSCSVVSASDPVVGSRVSPSTSLTPVGILQSGGITWTASVPENATLTISTSVDGGITWVAQSNNSTMAGLLAGANATGLLLLTLVSMAITGNDPTATPVVKLLQCEINPSYQDTKSDVLYIKSTTADFTTGTLTNLLAQPSNGGLTLNGLVRDWDDAAITSQTLFGNTTPGQTPFHGALVLTDAGNSDVRARFDFAGTWNVLDMSISQDIPDAAGNVSNGLVYGTTNWGNSNDSYAYAASVSATTVLLAKGSNSAGAGAFTQLAIFTFPIALTANSWHTLRVQWNGTAGTLNGIPAHTHNVYVDGVLYLSTVDASYTAAGSVGARMYNNLGVGNFTQGHFDNFSIVTSYVNTTWVSPNYSLNAVGTCGNSLLTWKADVADTSVLLAETSIDGGSTWQAATNGGAISGLSNGVSCIGKNLKVRFTFTEDIGQESILWGFSAWVMSQYSSSGSRISPALDITPANTIGASSISWAGDTPAGTTLAVDSSTDGSTFTPVTTSGDPVAGLVAQGPQIWDTFDTDSRASYTLIPL
jgi:hypothetical protein